MIAKLRKVKSLLQAPNTYDRVRVLTEIIWNIVFYGAKPCADSGVQSLYEFRGFLKLSNHPLASYLELGSEGHVAVESIRRNFGRLARSMDLPYPLGFNADFTLALLSYGVVRCRRPRVVIESGVGYGITSALLLEALEAEGTGRLESLDLSSLSDVHGAFTGLAVPEGIKQRWSLKRNISSRKFLPELLETTGCVDVFISDSANVHTLQRFELSTVWPKLSRGGFVLLNNVSGTFQRFLKGLPAADVWNIWQIEKPGCVTTLIEKR